jgi:hypothetical protein
LCSAVERSGGWSRPTREKRLGGGDRFIDIGKRRERVSCQNLAVGGVGDRQRVGRAAAAATQIDELLAGVVDRGGHGCSFALRCQL